MSVVRRSPSLLLGLSLIPASLFIAPLHAQTHLVEPADIADLKTIAGPKLSPDGSMIAYSVHTPTAAGKPRNEHIWLTSTGHAGTSRLFIGSGATDNSPEWSPDGKHIAFLSNRVNPLADKDQARPEDEAADAKDMQLWSIAIDGGEAEPLTSVAGGIHSFKWSHNGTRIAYIRSDSDTKAVRDRKKIKDDRNYIDHEYHFARIWLYELATHTSHVLTTRDENADTLDWSPDDSEIVSRISPTPRLDDYWRVSKVKIYDTTSGAEKKVIEEHSGYQTPLFSADGTRIAYSRFTPKGIADIHLVRTLADGQDVLLEDKLKGTLAEMQWLAGSHLLVNSYVAAHTEATDIDVSTLAATPLGHLPLTALDFDATRDGATMSFLGETPSQPLEVSVWKQGGVQVLTSTNPQTSGWSLGTEREVSWQNPKDHHVIYGVLTLPPGYQAGKKYKTVVHLHGGPEEAFTVGFNATWYNYAALLGSQGYVVFQPNYRGSAGQEIAFTEGNFMDWGGSDFADMMSGVDWVVGQGIADNDKLAIAGWSYGGFMTSWGVTHSNRFKVAMAGAAVTDVSTMSITTDIAPRYVSGYLGPLNLAEYDKHSAVRFVKACHTPVLVLHGESDVRVPLSQGQEFYNALKFSGLEAEMVTYPREPHIFGEREHQVDSLTRELAWFDKYLAPAK